MSRAESVILGILRLLQNKVIFLSKLAVRRGVGEIPLERTCMKFKALFFVTMASIVGFAAPAGADAHSRKENRQDRREMRQGNRHERQDARRENRQDRRQARHENHQERRADHGSSAEGE